MRTLTAHTQGVGHLFGGFATVPQSFEKLLIGVVSSPVRRFGVVGHTVVLYLRQGVIYVSECKHKLLVGGVYASKCRSHPPCAEMRPLLEQGARVASIGTEANGN
jgi:hypothetical protein